MANPFFAGVHTRADGPMDAPDWEAIRVAKLIGPGSGLKLMTTSRPENVDQARAFGIKFIPIRCHADLKNRETRGADFAQWMKGDLRPLYNRFTTPHPDEHANPHVEVHNEPNLWQEGQILAGTKGSWSNGREFADYYIEAVSVMKQDYPDARFGFPGLSPGGDVPGIRYNADRFWQEASDRLKERNALSLVDWVGLHFYWLNEVGRIVSLKEALKSGRRYFPDKPYFITEMANPNKDQSFAEKGKQYGRCYAELAREVDVFGAFVFVLSSSHAFEHEVWRDETGRLNEIPAEVAKRDLILVPPPVPVPPPVSEKLDLVGRPATVIKPVNARYDNRDIAELLPAGLPIRVYGNSFTTADGVRLYMDSPRRHVWVPNIQEGSGEVIDRWRVAANALFESFGRDRETLITMLAIGAAESAQYTQDRGDFGSGNPIYHCQGYASFGPWQVYAPAHFDKYESLTGVTNPCDWYAWTHSWHNAARIAKAVLDASSYNAWTVYKEGTYLVHLPRATSVVDELLAALPDLPPGLPSGGFDSPIGEVDERAGEKLWPGEWIDAWHPRTGYARQYTDGAGHIAYHTGADLNLNLPIHNSDAGKPIYAIADGEVTWAGKLGSIWLNIIVIQHEELLNGPRPVSRLAHVDQMLVRAGERVQRGQQVAVVGRSGGVTGNHHLHFDISLTDALLGSPGHWPGSSLELVLRHYVDPIEFIRGHRPERRVQVVSVESPEGEVS